MIYRHGRTAYHCGAMTSVGLISDTHGLLRPEAVAALAGVDLILHAGDVGDPAIIDTLRRIAPVHAVLGNVDTGAWLPESRIVQIEDSRVCVLHDISDLSSTANLDAVVYGHSHKPSIENKNGVLFVNPGSAGRRRFRLPATVGRLRVEGTTLEAEIITIAE